MDLYLQVGTFLQRYRYSPSAQNFSIFGYRYRYRMKIAIFGATGQTGLEAVKQALAANHSVTAIVR